MNSCSAEHILTHSDHLSHTAVRISLAKSVRRQRACITSLGDMIRGALCTVTELACYPLLLYSFPVCVQVCRCHGFGRANRQHWNCTYEKCCEARKDSANTQHGWWVFILMCFLTYLGLADIPFVCIGCCYFMT